jgi:hypothetical protein
MLNPRRQKLLFGSVFAIAAFAFVCVCVHDFVWCSDDYGETTSRNATEAKARGVWIASLKAAPAELPLPGRTIHIDSAWIEYRSHRSERIMSPTETRLDGYSLCFTLAEGPVGHDYFFVPDDDGAGLTECGWSDGRPVYVADLEQPSDARSLRLSLVSSWHEPLHRNISFAP